MLDSCIAFSSTVIWRSSSSARSIATLEAVSEVAAVPGAELVSACATVALPGMGSVADAVPPTAAAADIASAPVPASFASSRRVKSVVMAASPIRGADCSLRQWPLIWRLQLSWHRSSRVRFASLPYGTDANGTYLYCHARA